MIEPGDYGTVVATAGRWKGKIGYYDDESDSPGCAIVYFDTAHIGDYVSVRYSSLRKATKKEEETYHQQKMNDIAIAKATKKLRNSDDD